MDLEEVWRIREDDIYPKYFGPVSRGLFPLTQELFMRRFGPVDIDPRWLSLGIFEFAPTLERASWLYVTSGYSNPWHEDPTDYREENESGAGIEFTFAVSEQGDWAIQTLQAMLALDLLLGAGQLGTRQPLSFHARIPLHAPINGDQTCQIRNLVVVEREDGPSEFVLPSGKVILAGFTGITDAELAFAKTDGSVALIERLRAAGFHPTTNPRRPSII